MDNIRNFCIIAHVDHGKSTLADRFLEITGTVDKRQMKAQYLDQLESERERGITIKMAPVRMLYAPQNYAERTQNSAEEFLYSDLTYKIRGAIFEVRKNLGLGHKENVYHQALIHEFSKRAINFESEKNVNIFYDGKKVGSYQPDFIIDNKVLIELKALPEIGRPQIEQLWSHLRGSDFKLAFLVNFGTADLEIKRVIYDSARNHNSNFLRSSASGQRNSAQVEYILNLIDTPGHSDFSYEVSRALAAVEGAILLVDATQGIQAQTLANFNSAKRAGLAIIGAVNKIDLNPPMLNEVIKSTAELLGVSEEEIFKVSGKTGQGVRELLEGVIELVPAPQNYAERTQNSAEINFPRNFALSPRESAINARALIFDSFYHEHKGIVVNVRVFGGSFKSDDNVRLIATNTDFKVKELGYFSPELKPLSGNSSDNGGSRGLENGEIGYIATGLKNPELLKIGDTIILRTARSASLALPGYQEPQPVVFVSFYPEAADDYENLKSAFGKLKLNDSALKFEPDFNEFLGRGFKTGFLGKLHFEITAERLEKEFKIRTVHSFPSVAYKVRPRSPLESAQSAWITVSNPKDFPDDYLEVLEPVAKIEILTPPPYLGSVVGLQSVFRLSAVSAQTLGNNLAISANLPLSDLIRDFDDQLKSVSAGYASLSYEVADYRKTEVAKLSVLVAGQEVSGLTRIVHKDDLEKEARKTVERLKELLPKQQFAQALQAVANGRIMARETIPALKKLLGYFGKTGGDRTRKMKLWKKQQRGKEKLKELGAKSKIDVPASVFKELLKK